MVPPRPAARAAWRSLRSTAAGAVRGGGRAALARQHEGRHQAAHAVGRWRAWCTAQPGALLSVTVGRGPAACGSGGGRVAVLAAHAGAHIEQGGSLCPGTAGVSAYAGVLSAARANMALSF